MTPKLALAVLSPFLLASAVGFAVPHFAMIGLPMVGEATHRQDPHKHVGTIHGSPRLEDFCVDATLSALTQSQLTTRVNDTLINDSVNWNKIGAAPPADPDNKRVDFQHRYPARECGMSDYVTYYPTVTPGYLSQAELGRIEV